MGRRRYPFHFQRVLERALLGEAADNAGISAGSISSLFAAVVLRRVVHLCECALRWWAVHINEVAPMALNHLVAEVLRRLAGGEAELVQL